MFRNILFWILALVITLASAVYQRATGPTYPVDGEAELAGNPVSYSLTRSHGGDGDQPIRLHTPNGGITGALMYKPHKTDDSWTAVPLRIVGDTLVGMLPHQPPAGKLEYMLELESDGALLRLPEKETIVTRFKGAVPMWALIPHVIAMFLAMFISTRTGLEALRKTGHPRNYALWTTGLLIIGGLILGPIVQKYAFGAYWTGFPFGTDLTDNKTLIAFIAWVIAIAAIWNRENFEKNPLRRWFVVAASVVMLAVYLIPHSRMGSEIDYREMDRLKQQADSIAVESADPAHMQPASDSEADGDGMTGNTGDAETASDVQAP